MALIQDAVLGLLAREPSYGYALWRTMQGWSSDPDSVASSSVYMAITRMAKAGIVEPVGDSPPVPGSGKHPRHTYGLTDAGRDRLGKWLAQRPSSMDEFRLRIALAQPGDDLSALIAWVTAELAETQRRLGAYASQQGRLGVAPGDRSHEAPKHPWDVASAMALSALEFRELSARAQWLAEAHAQLQSLRTLAASHRQP